MRIPIAKNKGMAAKLWIAGRVLLLAAALVSPRMSLAAAEAPPEQIKAVSSTGTFTPEVEAKRVKLFEMLVVEERKNLAARMTGIIAEIQKVTGLDAAGAKALEAPAEAACERRLNGWAKTFPERFRMGQEEFISTRIDSLIRQASRDPSRVIASTPLVPEYGPAPVRPEEELVWREGMAQTLSPDQAKQWRKVCLEKERKLRVDLEHYLQQHIDPQEEPMMAAALGRSRVMRVVLSPAPETAERLDALARNVTDQRFQSYRDGAAGDLYNSDEQQREQFFQGHAAFSLMETTESAAAWEAKATALLTADENKRWSEAKTERALWQPRAAADILLVTMDAQTALTSWQRTQLLPLCSRLVAAMEENILANEGLLQPYYALAGKATAADLSGILDAAQIERWQAAGNDSKKDGAANEKVTAPFKDLTDTDKVQNWSFDYLAKQSATVRRRVVSTLMLGSEDAARSAALPAAVAARLSAAAKGVADRLVHAWEKKTEVSTRDCLAKIDPNASAEDWVEKFLKRIPRPPDLNDLANVPTWRQAIARELTASQLQNWNTEVEGRRHFHDEAITALAIYAFDQITPISPSQATRLEPLILGLLREYGADLDEEMTDFNEEPRIPWYLEAFPAAPIACLPEKDLAAILTAEQLEAWHPHSGDGSLWSRVQETHRERLAKKK